MKIAISGKGGVGKTFITSVLAQYFLRKGFKVLAIDADPSPNLGVNLGLTFNELKNITPISENFDLIKSKTDSGVPSIYKLTFEVEDVIKNYSIVTPSGVNLIIMGVIKSSESGCTCPANAFIKILLKHLLSKKDEVIIMDMEAGTEHLGRGTAKYMDVMLIISDPSLKSLEIASKIHELSINMGLKHIFLIGNKVLNKKDEENILNFSFKNRLNVIGFIPYDYEIMKADLYGEYPYKFQSESIRAIEEIGEKILNMKNKTTF
ncbi:MAG: AAA family ATPase [Candidatus Bathyarchaeia archaeon]|nr:AAA family ATPase [Candidatus Bathyarchaeota archaeon]